MGKTENLHWTLSYYLDWATFAIDALGRQGLAELRAASTAANRQLAPFFLRPFPEGLDADPMQSHPEACLLHACARAFPSELGDAATCQITTVLATRAFSERYHI